MANAKNANKISLVNTEGFTPVIAEKTKSDATIGKVNREIVLTFESGSLSARTSQNGNLACNGRAVDQNGLRWNVTTCMPLSPSNNKAVKTDDVNLDEFLGDQIDSD
tara:strand:+ start:689 stop:1009 length:321 start_codon:yes stop_codon:yes gene_type:complete